MQPERPPESGNGPPDEREDAEAADGPEGDEPNAGEPDGNEQQAEASDHPETEAGDAPGQGPKEEEPGARLKELESRLQRLEQERDEAKNRFLRSRADYDNLVRRTEREREETRKTAAARLIGELLPQVEILERAAREISEVDESHAKGIRMAVSSLKTALEREGLQEVPGEGAPFDPQHHEAVTREESAEPEGTVTQVIRPGYKLHDRLLQAALVKVSAGPKEGAEGEEAASEASKSPT